MKTVKTLLSLVLIIAVLVLRPNNVYASNSLPALSFDSYVELLEGSGEYALVASNDNIFYLDWGAGAIPVKIRYVDTPNTQNGVEVFWVLDDYSSEILNYNNSVCDAKYSNATRLSTSTVKYNCHSYAWYSQDVANNEYWMNDPSIYYNDYSYCSVSTPSAGDIICYFDDKGTVDDMDDINLHSGIVESVINGVSNNLCGSSDMVTVVSKWGALGLYLHNGYECPYTSYGEGTADYVRYYRNHHDYNFTYTSSQHTARCIECGYEYVRLHTYRYVQYTNDNHKAICECGYQKTVAHVIEHSSASIVQCIRCKAWIKKDGPIQVLKNYTQNMGET